MRRFIQQRFKKIENWIGSVEVSERCQEIVLYVFILLGVTVAVSVFVMNRSLWLDEAMVANNIVGRSFAELLEPLCRNQVAPIGFLYVEKLMTILLGRTDRVLSIFPLFSFLLSIPLFFSINRELFKSKMFALFSCAIFSLTISLLTYSSEVKQYSSDVLISLLIIWIAIHFSKSQNTSSHILYTLGGALAIWFSNVAVIILFTVGIDSLYRAYKSDKKQLIAVSLPIVFWLLSFFIYYVWFIHDHPTQGSMNNYWKSSFLPANVFQSEFYLFLFTKTRMMFSSLLGFSKLWILALPLFLVGISVNRKSKKILFLTLAPLLVHLALSGFQMYPFDRRLILYLTPFIVILFSQGIWVLFGFLNTHNRTIGLLFLSIPLLFNLREAVKAVPFEHEALKKSMDFVSKNIDSGSKIYVSERASPAFDFYLNDYPKIKQADTIIYGRRDLSKHENQVLDLSGNFWLLFSRAFVDKPNGITEGMYILEKLEERGDIIKNRKEYHRSSAYEIDED